MKNKELIAKAIAGLLFGVTSFTWKTCNTHANQIASIVEELLKQD